MTTPAIGSLVKLTLENVTCPFADKVPADFLRGWAAYFKGESDPGTTNLSVVIHPRDTASDLYRKGYLSARGHKALRESHVWTFAAVEEKEGKRLAVLTRTEPRCLDDVYNGSGTGLGTVTITERVEIWPRA
jgi:hypothetical protein